MARPDDSPSIRGSTQRSSPARLSIHTACRRAGSYGSSSSERCAAARSAQGRAAVPHMARTRSAKDRFDSSGSSTNSATSGRSSGTAERHRDIRAAAIRSPLSWWAALSWRSSSRARASRPGRSSSSRASASTARVTYRERWPPNRAASYGDGLISASTVVRAYAGSGRPGRARRSAVTADNRTSWPCCSVQAIHASTSWSMSGSSPFPTSSIRCRSQATAAAPRFTACEASSPTESTSCSATGCSGSSSRRDRRRSTRSSARPVACASTAATPARTASSPSASPGSSASVARYQAAGHAAGAVGRHPPRFGPGAVGRAALPARPSAASVSRICGRTRTSGSPAARTRNGSTSTAAGSTELPSPQHATCRSACASSAVRGSGDQTRSSRSGPCCQGV